MNLRGGVGLKGLKLGESAVQRVKVAKRCRGAKLTGTR